MTFHKYLADSKMFEYDKHYRDCQQQNRPFIKAKVNPQHGNYFVQIDLMPCNYELTNKEQEEFKKLFENKMKNIKSNPAFQGFKIDKDIAWFDGLSPEIVDDFCISLYDLTQKYHN